MDIVRTIGGTRRGLVKLRLWRVVAPARLRRDRESLARLHRFVRRAWAVAADTGRVWLNNVSDYRSGSLGHRERQGAACLLACADAALADHGKPVARP